MSDQELTEVERRIKAINLISNIVDGDQMPGHVNYLTKADMVRKAKNALVYLEHYLRSPETV